MSYEIHLHSGPVACNRHNLGAALRAISQRSGIELHCTDEDTIAFGVRLPALHRGALAISMSLRAQRLTLSTRAQDAVLSSWLAHELARQLRGRVVDPQAEDGRVAEISTEQVRLLLDAHEAEVLRDEPYRAVLSAPEDCEPETVSLVRLLLRTGRLEIMPGAEAALFELARAHASGEDLYEALLESEVVDDIFLSQSEFLAQVVAVSQG